MTHNSTPTRQVARAAHICTWCGERIEPKATYERWVTFDDSVFASKLHLECVPACHEECSGFDGYYIPYEKRTPCRRSGEHIMMPAGLTFDDASHTYRFNGKLVPGVTSVLAPLSSLRFVDPVLLEAASNFGKAVHKACELWDLGTLDESALDAKLVPYLEGWKKFSVDWLVQWTMVEAVVHNDAMGYAGTLDRFGSAIKPQGSTRRPLVADIKSGSALYPSVGPQLAAYKNAIPKCPPICDRVAVQLKDDGTYIAKVYADRDDWPLFASLLTVKQWCDRHSITPFYPQP